MHRTAHRNVTRAHRRSDIFGTGASCRGDGGSTSARRALHWHQEPSPVGGIDALLHSCIRRVVGDRGNAHGKRDRHATFAALTAHHNDSACLNTKHAHPWNPPDRHQADEDELIRSENDLQSGEPPPEQDQDRRQHQHPGAGREREHGGPDDQERQQPRQQVLRSSRELHDLGHEVQFPNPRCRSRCVAGRLRPSRPGQPDGGSHFWKRRASTAASSSFRKTASTPP